MTKRYKDITGQRFGKLVAQKYLYTDPTHRTAVWLCKCDCGNMTKIRADVLKSQTRSCGCLQTEHARAMGPQNKTHGLVGTRLYRIYHGMLARCYRKSCPAYKNYGGRGIKMCNEWKQNILAFYDWAQAAGYQDSLSIDRINNDGDYSPDNCRWATHAEQGKNTRTTHYITHNGQTKCVTDWAKELGVCAETIRRRAQRKQPIDKKLPGRWK